MILNDQNRYYDCFGSKTASQKGFCGALTAFRHMDGKRALIHNSVREATGREELILTAPNQDYDCFWQQNGITKGLLRRLARISPFGRKTRGGSFFRTGSCEEDRVDSH
jgi:hypothetical protein